MADDISQYLQGLQLLGGILALPRSAQYAQEDALRKRALLANTGLSQGEIDAIAPTDAPMGWLRAGPGVGGKILGGVGDVGTLLSTIAGKPIGPPRADLSEIASAAKMRTEFAQQGKLKTLQQRMAEGPRTKQDGTLQTATEFEREIASLGVGAGSAGEALRVFSRSGQMQPWRGTPGERVELTEGAQRASRAARRPALLAAGHDPKAIDYWVETGSSMPQGRQDTGAGVREREAAEEDVRKDQASRMNLQPGTPEYDAFVYRRRPLHQAPEERVKTLGYFFEKALAVQRQQVGAGLREKVDPEEAKVAAAAEYEAYKGLDPKTPAANVEPPPRPMGAPAPSPPPAAPPLPLTAETPPSVTTSTPTSRPVTESSQLQPPPPPPAEGMGPPPPADYREPPPPPTPLPDLSAMDPTDRAALIQALQAGLTPLGVSTNFPQLWQRSGMVGQENAPRDGLLMLLTEDTGQGPTWTPTPTTTSTTLPADSPLAKPFSINDLTPEGQAQAQIIQKQVIDGQLAPGVGAARLQVLPRLPGR